MFKPKLYRNACDRLTLDAGKIEEMITMTENQNMKTVHRRPARMALIAAALAAALGITASAAEIPAVKEFFATVFVTVTSDDGMLSGMKIPTVAVEEREGRTILLLDEEEIDVTEAIANGGEYLYEGDGYAVRVDSEGNAVLTVSSEKDGEVISITTAPGVKDEKATYNVATEGDDVIKTGTYEVTADEASGAVSVTDEEGRVFDYQWDGTQLTPAE